MAIAPDETRMASGHEGRFRGWDLHEGKEIWQGEAKGGSVDALAFSSDSERLAIAGSQSEPTVWGVAQRKELWTSPQRRGRVLSLSFSPDGRMLAVGWMEGGLSLLRSETGDELQHVKPADRWGTNAVCFSPDGAMIAFSKGNVVNLGGLKERKVLRELRGHGYVVSHLAFFADGGFLISADHDGVVVLLER